MREAADAIAPAGANNIGWSTDWSAALPSRSPAEEGALIASAEDAVRALQAAAQRVSGGPPRRAFHASAAYATTNARFEVAPGIPPELCVGPFAGGASYRAIVRFSNASPTPRADALPDQRGIAVRFVGPEDRAQDLLMTSGSEAHHAKNAEALISTLRAAAAAADETARGKIRAVLGLVGDLGLMNALRLVSTTSRLADSGVSLAGMDYFSRAPFRLGRYAVKLRFASVGEPKPLVVEGGDDALLRDFVARRAQRDVRFRLEAHGFVDRRSTPLDDHRVSWSSPWVSLGDLVFARRPAGTDEDARDVARRISETMSFSPFNRWDQSNPEILEPLGDLNLLRKAYRVSVGGTGRQQGMSPNLVDQREAD